MIETCLAVELAYPAVDVDGGVFARRLLSFCEGLERLDTAVERRGVNEIYRWMHL